MLLRAAGSTPGNVEIISGQFLNGTSVRWHGRKHQPLVILAQAGIHLAADSLFRRNDEEYE